MTKKVISTESKCLKMSEKVYFVGNLKSAKIMSENSQHKSYFLRLGVAALAAVEQPGAAVRNLHRHCLREA